MTKAVFAGKKIKKFALGKRFYFTAFLAAIFPWFFKNFFMRHCPGNAGYGKG